MGCGGRTLGDTSDKPPRWTVTGQPQDPAVVGFGYCCGVGAFLQLRGLLRIHPEANGHLQEPHCPAGAQFLGVGVFFREPDPAGPLQQS